MNVFRLALPVLVYLRVMVFNHRPEKGVQGNPLILAQTLNGIIEKRQRPLAVDGFLLVKIGLDFHGPSKPEERFILVHTPAA